MSQRTASTLPGSEATAEPVRFPLPWAVGLGLMWSLLWRKRRSFAKDARLCVSLLEPPLQVLGLENIPSQGPCLVTSNHYAHPGFQAWWITLTISACLPFELHWVMTDAWRFEGRPFAAQLESLSRHLFRGIARAYDFTSMPPMPPREDEAERRAQAVRSLLRYARRHTCPAIGLAPEGYDISGGVLGLPPPGVGRLIVHLLPYTQHILPVAIYEDQGLLCLRFGEPYTPNIPADSKNDVVDHLVSDTIMCAIALLLPSHLRGEYSQ
jgi:hypothetical protein